MANQRAGGTRSLPAGAGLSLIACVASIAGLVTVLPDDELAALGVPEDLPSEVVAVDLRTGETLWLADADGATVSLQLGDGVVLVQTLTFANDIPVTSVAAFALDDGTRRWRHDRALATTPLGDGVALHLVEDGENATVVVDAGSGRRRWSVDGLVARGRAGGLVLATALDGGTHGLDAGTGEVVWDQDGDPVDPGGSNSVVVLQTYDTRTGGATLRGIDASTGSVRWSADGNGSSTGLHAWVPAEIPGADAVVVDVDTGATRPLPDDLGRFTAAGEDGGVAVLQSETGLVAVDAARGTVRWRRSIPDEQVNAIGAGTVVASRDQALTVIDLANGAVLWQATLDGYAVGGALDDDTLIVQDERRGAAYDLATGARRWSRDSGTAPFVLAGDIVIGAG